jgi:hypothetical protein
MLPAYDECDQPRHPSDLDHVEFSIVEGCSCVSVAGATTMSHLNILEINSHQIDHSPFSITAVDNDLKGVARSRVQ